MFQTKEQNKFPETDLNETEMCNLPFGEFKIMVIKMLTKIRRITETQSIKKYQTEITELKNTITELKNSIERFNSRLCGRNDQRIR